MDLKQFQALIDRYLSEQCTPQEIQTLSQLLVDPMYVDQLGKYMDKQLMESTVSASDYPEVVERLKHRIEKEISAEKKIYRFSARTIVRWTAVAAIFILVATVGFEWITKKNNPTLNGSNEISSSQKIEPGKEGAILTLSDNRTILLDSAGNGLIATENGSKIEMNNGQVIYNASEATEVTYNTMTTPKGRQFRLVLPDGTRAWLNAASSLRYPTAFRGNERKVEVTGEVYFEVAKNKAMPFRVGVNKDMQVVVLGTHFNVNSYSNEASINTTLLEGSVQIANKDQKVILKPGQQAQINPGKKINVVNDVNFKKVMAWKDGVFDFNNASLQEVMRQLERWYDIEVVYEKGVPDIEFVGRMGRDLSLSDVLKGLKLSEVHFRLEGRKLIVMP
jgi:transmembrane sensor